MHCFWGLAPIERKARKRVLTSADLKEKRGLAENRSIEIALQRIYCYRLSTVIECVALC